MAAELRHRIDAMFARDRGWALVLVVFLWVTTGVVFFGVQSLITIPGIKIALIVSALLVLIFNTASMLAMIRHYESDKDFIYGIDIRHLDAQRSEATQRTQQP